jgi:cytochrome P450
VHRWYQFHRRLYGYRLPAELMSVSSADDPMVARLRKVYIAALAEALERHGPEMAAHIDRWIDRVARGPVNVATAIRRLNAELSHLLAFGKLPADPMYVLAYTYIEFTLRDSKRRLAHLLWPPLDRLPTPYGLASWTRGAVTKGSAAIYYWRQRHKTDSFLGRMRELGAAEGDPDFVFRTMPLFVDAVNALLPHPMMMSLIELAAKPDVQQRVVDEDLFAEAIKETLRLHPPLTTIARVTTDRVESESAVLERMASSEGQVYINSTAIHRDPRGWPRPDDFIVDRWLPGWSDGGDPDRRLYIPFGLGARSCVAASFASKILEGFLRQVLTRRIVSNPSGRAPRIAQGSQAFVRRPFVLQFEDRPARSGRA